MKNKLLFILLFALPLVHAQMVSITQNSTVGLFCNNQSDCVIVVPGQAPLFLHAVDTNMSFQVPATFSYEQNESNSTVINNTIFIMQNITNITVVNCNLTEQVFAPRINISTSEVTAGILSNMNASIAAACRSSCEPSTAERDTLLKAKNDAEAQLSVKTVTCESQLNVTTTGYESQLNISLQHYEQLNATSTLEIEAARNESHKWMYLAILVLFLFIAFIVMFTYQSRKQSIASGHKSSTPRKRTGEEV